MRYVEGGLLQDVDKKEIGDPKHIGAVPSLRPSTPPRKQVPFPLTRWRERPSLFTVFQKQGKFLRSALFEPLKFVSCPWRSFKLTDVMSFWAALCVCPGIKSPPASQLGRLLLRSVSAEPALWLQPSDGGSLKQTYMGIESKKKWHSLSLSLYIYIYDWLTMLYSRN